MREFSKEVKMSKTKLQHVEDLEKSPQWTSLADEIFYLERMCHLNNHRHAKKQGSKFPNYQKRSVPQVQKATSVWIEPNDELNENVEQSNDLPKADIDEAYRWSWRPKTEFERTYFFNDYNQNQFQDEAQKRFRSLPCNESFDQSTEAPRSNEYQKGPNPVLQTNQSRSFKEDKFSQVYNRIIEHNGSESTYSGTRERLHEIFERNRYLRRKFFSSMPDNDTTNYANDFPKSFNNKSSGTVSKYNGFGSTETLTSQSNQSSISSTNDRKSRGQANITPELVEEERSTGEFPQRSDYSKNTLTSSVSHVPGVHITSTTNESKLLVNILPGNEVYVLKEPTSYHDAISKQDFGSNGVAMSEQDLSGNRKINVDESQQYAPSMCTMCCEQLDSGEEIKSKGRQLGSDLKGGSVNGVYSDSQVIEKEREYIIPDTPKEKYHVENIKTDKENVEPQDSEYLRQFLSEYGPKESIHEPKFSVQVDNSRETSDNKNEHECVSWTKRNDWYLQQGLCKSLPNLILSEGTSESLTEVQPFIDETASPSKYNVRSNTKLSTDVTNRCNNERNTAGDHKYYTSQIDLSSSHKEPLSLHLRRVKLTKVPAPLDLSRVNEKYEEMEAFERRQLNNFAVDVRLRRNYDRPLKGQPTIVKDECSSDDTQRESKCKELSTSRHKRRQENVTESGSCEKNNLSRQKPLKKENTSRFLHKSCGDLTAMGDLQSPQLVNNYKNSMLDLRTGSSIVNSVQSSQVVEFDTRQNMNAGTPLPDHVNSISGLQTGTGTTLPSVYGPIPYKSPRRYVEGEVTIHYRSPVRTEAKEPLSEEELARRSAENMRRVYQEERRRKYLQELHDIDSRRHTDNFIPSQKSPIPLNRYDDFVDDLSHRSRSQEQTPEPRLVARALYNFIGQSSRELNFRSGDIIFVRRQVDKNWYEGEHNAMIGLFPSNYVEILPYDGMRTTPKKPYEGQARAKFNFVAQTNLELSLVKGELVVLIRRIDKNWYEGRIGNRKGIFPISYVEVITEPGHRSETPTQSKPVASPAAHSLLANGSAGGKMSMGPHHYMPSIPVNINTTQPHYNSLPRMGGSKLHVTQLNEALHIDTHSEPVPYRALYSYRPQNEDELELKEGDTVYVMEKCDDGWYVGSSQRTGYFGTFPGNYVVRL